MRRWLRRGQESEASCAEVAKVLQSYLDGHVDELNAARVRRHLDSCRRCGLESDTYQAIKQAIARRSHQIDLEAYERLRAFAERVPELSEEDDLGSA